MEQLLFYAKLCQLSYKKNDFLIMHNEHFKDHYGLSLLYPIEMGPARALVCIKDNTIIVVLKGTDSFDDLLIDAQVGFYPIETTSSSHSLSHAQSQSQSQCSATFKPQCLITSKWRKYGLVHAGFYKYAMYVWPQIHEKLVQLLQDQNRLERGNTFPNTNANANASANTTSFTLMPPRLRQFATGLVSPRGGRLVRRPSAETYEGANNMFSFYLGHKKIVTFDKYEEGFNEFKIVFTGHSLGSACTILALIFANNYKYLKRYVKCITFGSPKLGNKKFAHLCSKSIGDIKRVEHKHDVVPTLPVSALYYHIDSSMVLDDENVLLTRGDANKSCGMDLFSRLCMCVSKRITNGVVLKRQSASFIHRQIMSINENNHKIASYITCIENIINKERLIDDNPSFERSSNILVKISDIKTYKTFLRSSFENVFTNRLYGVNASRASCDGRPS